MLDTHGLYPITPNFRSTLSFQKFTIGSELETRSVGTVTDTSGSGSTYGYFLGFDPNPINRDGADALDLASQSHQPSQPTASSSEKMATEAR